ncbi:MAG: O-antigen ligase family protein [Rhizobiales bacterium]|nr:O-antigen ligase family protein [Hyphomicrobiales bacterium]
MNSTASLNATEGGRLARAVSAPGVPAVLAALLLAVLLVSFRPFQPTGGAPDPQGGGDVLNQIGFSGLGSLALLGVACYADPRKLSVFFSPWWLIVLAFFAFSIMNATDPSIAVRGGFFTLIGIVIVVAVLALPRSAEEYCKVFAFATIVVMVISYAGLVALPNAAMHTASGAEPQHAGLWRGVFAHKNIAGPVMATFSFAGLYLLRRGWKRSGAFLLIGGIVFVANTGSKTSAGLVPAAILLVAGPGLIGMRRLAAFLVALTLVGTALATLGMVFLPPVKSVMLSLFPDLTYTGRVTLWEFAGEMIMKRPWTGYGFESFWRGVAVMATDHPFDRAWDVRTMVHGHDGYIDIAVAMGLPALCFAVVALLVEPLRDYVRIPPLKENILLGDFFMMTFAFIALNAFLESFFFRRVDPVWMLFLVSVLGLRLVARYRIPAAAGR